jgi:hypothetical protein
MLKSLLNGLAALAIPVLVRPAPAQQYPRKPVRSINGSRPQAMAGILGIAVKALQRSKFRPAKVIESGLPRFDAPARCGEFVGAEPARWGKVAKDSGAKAE